MLLFVYKQPWSAVITAGGELDLYRVVQGWRWAAENTYTLLQLSMSSRAFLLRLQLAPEAPSGSQLTDAEEKLSDSLQPTQSQRETGRERDSLSVHMFIRSPRILFYLPTRSHLRLFPLPPTLPRSLLCCWFAGYCLLLLRPAAGTRRLKSNGSPRLIAKKAQPASEALPNSLQGLLFQPKDSESIAHA